MNFQLPVITITLLCLRQKRFDTKITVIVSVCWQNRLCLHDIT